MRVRYVLKCTGHNSPGRKGNHMIHGDKIFKSTKNPSQWAKAVFVIGWLENRHETNAQQLAVREGVSLTRLPWTLFFQTVLHLLLSFSVEKDICCSRIKTLTSKLCTFCLKIKEDWLTSMIVTFWQSPDLNCTSMAALEKVEKAKYSWHHKELFGTLSNHAEITWLIMWSLRQHCQDCCSIPPVEFHWLVGSVPRRTEAALVTHVDPTPR